MNKLIVLLTVSCALILTGCENEDAALAQSTSKEDLVSVEFNPKSGLLIPPATAAFIDVKTEDVGEASLASELELSGQVYRSASDSHTEALASVTLKRDAAERIQQVATGHLAGTGLVLRVLRMEQSTTSDDDRELLIAIDDPNRTLSSGEFITARFAIGSTHPVTIVPRQALLQTTEGDFVYTVNGQRFVLTKVKLGTANERQVEILEGLYAGDKVVVHPVMTLWMTELHSVNGGDACCLVAKPKE